MRSGMRGGKPRDMATFKKGGTSRGAGAAKKGFDYATYKKGAKVKKYADGGAIRAKETGDYLRDPLTGTRQYASFSDLMGDLFGRKKVPASAMDETAKRAIRETERDRPAPEEDRETRRPAPGAARAMLPTAQQARMQRRRAAGPESPPTDQAVTGRSRSRIPRPMSEEEREAEQPDLSPRPRTPQNSQPQRTDPYAAERAARGNYILPRDVFDRTQTVFPSRDDLIDFQRRATKSTNYAKGGTVKKAGGGSCRGMGAAQRGGKYTIK